MGSIPPERTTIHWTTTSFAIVSFSCILLFAFSFRPNVTGCTSDKRGPTDPARPPGLHCALPGPGQRTGFLLASLAPRRTSPPSPRRRPPPDVWGVSGFAWRGGPSGTGIDFAVARNPSLLPRWCSDRIHPPTHLRPNPKYQGCTGILRWDGRGPGEKIEFWLRRPWRAARLRRRSSALPSTRTTGACETGAAGMTCSWLGGRQALILVSGCCCCCSAYFLSAPRMDSRSSTPVMGGCAMKRVEFFGNSHLSVFSLSPLPASFSFSGNIPWLRLGSNRISTPCHVRLEINKHRLLNVKQQCITTV